MTTITNGRMENSVKEWETVNDDDDDEKKKKTIRKMSILNDWSCVMCESLLFPWKQWSFLRWTFDCIFTGANIWLHYAQKHFQIFFSPLKSNQIFTNQNLCYVWLVFHPSSIKFQFFSPLDGMQSISFDTLSI